MLTQFQAHMVAQRYIEDVIQPTMSQPLALTGIREFPTSWVFAYNTEAYAKAGDPKHALPGGGMLIVHRVLGWIREGAGGVPIEGQV